MNYFQKILDLQLKSPRAGMIILNSENSDYTMYSADNKNCYILVGSERDENCMYGNWIYESKDCVDNDFLYKCELCHECVDCDGCYNCSFCQDCVTCTDCFYGYDLKGCQNCFGCAGLRNKNHHIFNKPYSTEEFAQKMKNIKGNRQELREFEDLKDKTPRLFAHVMNNENCTGDYIYNSKNSYFCFDVKKVEDCFYITSSIECKNCCDMANSYFGCELSYEVMSSIQLYNSNYSNFCYYCRDVEYCENCYHCNDCFGCFFLQHKQYCIFNEPYSKDEYFKKLGEIKNAMRQDETYGKHLPTTIKIEDSAIQNYFRQ